MAGLCRGWGSKVEIIMKTKLNWWRSMVKYGVVFFLFLGLLAGMRWMWMQAFETLEGPAITSGVADLRGVELEESSPLFLDGEWQFYPDALLHAGDEELTDLDGQSLPVPGNWKEGLRSGDDKKAYGYGTYRLRILTDPLQHPVSLWIQGTHASSEVEVNGRIVGRSGIPATSREAYVPEKGSYLATYYAQGETELEVLIRVANFNKPDRGGLLSPVRFGSQEALEWMRDTSVQFQVAIFCILLLHGLYAMILFLIHQERNLLYTALLVLTVGLLILSGYDSVLLSWIPITYTGSAKLRLILFLWQNTLILLIFRRLLYGENQGIGKFALLASLAGLSVWLLAAPADIIHHPLYSRLTVLVGFIPMVLLVPVLLRLIGRLRNNWDLAYLLMTAAGILANLGWRTFGSGHEYSSIYYPVDILVTIVAFSTYWFSKYFRQAREIAKLNEQLRQEDALKDQFLANTSHELRTPLHGIMTITDSVVSRQSETLNDEGRQDLQQVVQISRRMSHMLDNLLDMARLKEQRIRLRLEPVDLQAVVPGVLVMLRFLLKGKPIVLQTSLEESLPPVYADQERLVQILYNLIHNAIKYTERGTITLSAEADEEELFIQVKDTGVGMDSDTLKRAFQPYEQGEAGLRDGRGLGLGLSICKQMVELQGGSLTVQSKPSVGSVFVVTLPLARNRPSVRLEDAHASDATPLRREHWNKESWSEPVLTVEGSASIPTGDDGLEGTEKVKILIVDDDPVNLGVLSRLLAEEGYQIKTMTSPHQTLALAESGGWDMLIADVMMPGMSGYELTQRVRAHYSALDLPILLLTARSQPADIYTGFSSGANDYLTKPVDSLELKYRVRALAALKVLAHDKLRMEAAYLQAQIQPHFLFNTLNSIASLIDIDPERMSRMLDAFAAYLRISFDYLNTGELASLSRELELVKAYLYIEKERFQDRLQIVWQVETDELLLLPPLSIQPLVENAVRHGLLSRTVGGVLTIRILREDGRTRIEIEDDGKGMDAATTRQLLTPPGKRRRGIGVANTHRRLLQLYGKGLTIQSIPGEGTKVTFTIPDRDVPIAEVR